jgi:hypothetical protein
MDAERVRCPFPLSIVNCQILCPPSGENQTARQPLLAFSSLLLLRIGTASARSACQSSHALPARLLLANARAVSKWALFPALAALRLGGVIVKSGLGARSSEDAACTTLYYMQESWSVRQGYLPSFFA